VGLTTRQKATYEGSDWWKWSVWIDGSDAELDDVRCVTYYLHSTFPKPERMVDNRSTNFMLKSGGWGEFTIHLVVEKTDGSKTKLSHDLTLEYPPGSRSEAPERGAPQPRVFISYSTLDARFADSVRKVLGSRGIDVIDPADVGFGRDIVAEIASQISKADYVVALLSADTGKSVMYEVETALKNRTPVIAVELDEEHLAIPSDIPRVPLKSESDVEAVVESLLQSVYHAGERARKR
jgi:hypothetical protein